MGDISKINNNADLLNIKSLIYELSAIIEIFQLITCYELENLYKNIFDIKGSYRLNKDRIKTINSINDIVELMVKMNIITSDRYLLSLNSNLTFFDYLFNMTDMKKDSIRGKYLSRVYKLDANRMEKVL